MTKLTNRNLALAIALGVLVPLAVLGSNLTTPFTFSPGTPIKSADVNANFAAVQTAVNSKADLINTAKSGTRLQMLGYRSADGLAYPTSYLFDTTLSSYCYPLPASDGTTRCLPLFGDGYSGISFYSDPTCSTAVFEKGSLNVGGWPTQTSSYTYKSAMGDAGYYYIIHNLTQYFGPAYSYTQPDGGFGTCALINPGRPLFTYGTVVPPSTFVQLNGAIF